MKPADHAKDCPCVLCEEHRRNRAVNTLLVAAVVIALVVGSLFLNTGCTVVPDTVKATQASFDGNEQNSGVLAVAPGGGYYVTPHFRDRYNALIADYGDAFQPKLKRDAGLTLTHLLTDPPQERWVIDREHMVKMIEMNTWRKSGRAPTNK